MLMCRFVFGSTPPRGFNRSSSEASTTNKVTSIFKSLIRAKISEISFFGSKTDGPPRAYHSSSTSLQLTCTDVTLLYYSINKRDGCTVENHKFMMLHHVHLTMSLFKLISSLLILTACTSKALSTTAPLSSSSVAAGATTPPPIVYTIAGSDSGGGAGIQADLHAMHSMGCHGCSAITCLTAQSSTGVTGVHSPPTDFLRLQLDTLLKDLPPRAIKIGMLGSEELALEVGSFLQDLNQQAARSDSESKGEKPFVVFDPVMISTSGHKLIQDDAKNAIIESVFPHVDVVTPNKFEAEELLGRRLTSPQDVEQGAKEILDMGVKAVLIKGGHSLAEGSSGQDSDMAKDVNATIGYAQDYFLSSEPPLDQEEGMERLCDGCRGVWLRSNRYDSIHTHGTGCTLSSVIASALAIGHQQRALVGDDHGAGTGAARSIYMIDACVLAKAYVTAGVAQGVQLGHGPGPVAHTEFPSTSRHFPAVALDPTSGPSDGFLKMKSSFSESNDDGTITLGKLLPIVDNFEWMDRLTKLDGITDIQLRIKGETDEDKIRTLVQKCQKICQRDGVRLWINDFWKAAVEAKCFGVHVGQEDLARCADEGGLEKIKSSGLALGISTHSYAELAAVFGVNPSYISLGPVFGTKSKNVAFDPQGLSTVRKWKELIGPDIPLVAIGGINDAERAKEVKDAGADCVAVIGAVKKDDLASAVNDLEIAMN